MKSKLSLVILILSFFTACKKDSPSPPISPENIDLSVGESKYIIVASSNRDTLGRLIGALTAYNPDMSVKWSKNYWVEQPDHLLYSKGLLFISEVSGPVKALDIETGNEVWRYGSENSFYSGFCLQGDTLYIVSGSTYRLHVLNAKTGTALWTLSSDFIYTTPAIIGNTLMVQALPKVTLGAFYIKGIDISTHTEKWSIPASGWGPGALTRSDSLFYATSGGRDKFWAIDTSGTVRWSKTGTYVVTPIYDNGVLYSSFMEGLSALDPVMGYTKWFYKPLYGWGGSGAAINNGKLYVVRSNMSDLVFDTRSGQIIRETPTPYYYKYNVVVSNDMLVRLRTAYENKFDYNLVEIINPETGELKDSVKIVGERIGPVSILTKSGKWLNSNN
ncbi:PQQ-binding-like beta-propeller repeat protein [Niastella yeongjuensis]|nr:PQQ-binding-like beta-propeller repeat protein [Niastella yeongjuensis]SEN56140.1 Outer membrane protein assembly factor BamB, contains PQQ-like beta-propeller repeat [Niastella yeongjuensis]